VAGGLFDIASVTGENTRKIGSVNKLKRVKVTKVTISEGAPMNRKFWAILMAILAAVCWSYPAAAHVLKVRAEINGTSELVIQGTKVQWHNLEGTAPGLTYLTTYRETPGKPAKWKPKGWSSGVAGDTTCAPYTRLTPPLATAEQSVNLYQVTPRGLVTIVQQPLVDNGFQLIVRFEDAPEGSDWHEVEIYYNPGAPKYTCRDLGSLPYMTHSKVMALNNKGQACGESWDDFNVFSFFWNPKTKTLQNLGRPEGYVSTRCSSINNKGQVAGVLENYELSGLNHIFIWNMKTGLENLGNLGGYLANISWPYALNDQGQLCGRSQNAPSGLSPVHAFLWNAKTEVMQDLGTLGGDYSGAEAISSKGRVCGYATVSNGKSHAFLWDPKTKVMEDLGTLGGGESRAVAINSKGQVCGKSETSDGYEHAFLWDPKTKIMQDLDTLGGDHSSANAINSKGQVCGESQMSSGRKHAFLWDPKIKDIRDLGVLMGGDISYAFAINSKGQVCGQASLSNGQEHAFLWDPKTGVMQDLGTPLGGTDSNAYVINDHGQVGGYARDASGHLHAVIWSP
jgi:probable HAF family extracellular repeat protein